MASTGSCTRRDWRLRSPLPDLRRRLRLLYGDQAGDGAHQGLTALIERFRPRIRVRPQGREPFDQGTAVLITYGDTFLPSRGKPLTALRRFAGAHLKDLVSAIHVLPFFPYSSDYGFSVVDHLRVNPALGGWAEIATLHRDFRLMFDFVLNHVSAEGPWFQAFLRGEEPYAGYFIELDPRTDLSGVIRPRTTPLLTRFDTAHRERWVWTTFGSDQVDLNYANPQVLLRMVEVMLTYVERGADLLRLDAVGYLWKEVGTGCIHLPQAHEIVKLFREVLDELAPWVLIVTETNVPHAENVSYFGDGRDEAQLVYQFPLAPLVLDAFARADATRLSDWAGTLSVPSERTTFFNFLASHDGIGVVPARGLLPDAEVANLAQRVLAHGGQVSFKANPDGSQSPYELNTTLFDALSDPRDRSEPDQTRVDRFLCAQAVMLALAGVPGIYVHSLFGSHNDQAAYARSGWKRDLNHERLQLKEVESRLSDPTSHAARVFNGVAALLSARRTNPAFHPNAPQQVMALGEPIFAIRRGPYSGQTVVALHNLGASSQTVAGFGDKGRDLLSGRTLRTGEGLRLEPFQMLWLEAL